MKVAITFVDGSSDRVTEFDEHEESLPTPGQVMVLDGLRYKVLDVMNKHLAGYVLKAIATAAGWDKPLPPAVPIIQVEPLDDPDYWPYPRQVEFCVWNMKPEAIPDDAFFWLMEGGFDGELTKMQVVRKTPTSDTSFELVLEEVEEGDRPKEN